MTKKYNLKPGKHQFAPGSPAIHDNDSLSDDEAEWYLEKYPHIAGLFDESDAQVQPEQQSIPEITEADRAEQLDEYITFLNHYSITQTR